MVRALYRWRTAAADLGHADQCLVLDRHRAGADILSRHPGGREIERRRKLYVGDRQPVSVRGKTAIVVDDGIATGSTIKAAVEALRQQGPDKIIIAVPTTSTDAYAMLDPMADEFVALMIPEDFRAVGQWYEDFAQTSDAEVSNLLKRARER